MDLAELLSPASVKKKANSSEQSLRGWPQHFCSKMTKTRRLGVGLLQIHLLNAFLSSTNIKISNQEVKSSTFQVDNLFSLINEVVMLEICKIILL